MTATRRLGVRAAIVAGGLVRGDVAVADGRVVEVGLSPAAHGGIGGRHDSGGLAVPGFVDLQVNGFAGVDVAAADLDGYRRMATALAATGVTHYQPTLVSLPEAAYPDPLKTAAAAQAEALDAHLLGVHLEGPFLSPARFGAHDPANLRDPDLALLNRLRQLGPVTHVTLAPELPGALAVVADLHAAGVTVAVGHTDADAATAHAAFDRGARAVTHLFNAMRPFGHRDPGIAGVALARRGVVVTVIADGIHLAPDTLTLVHRAKRGELALITDAIAATGQGDGPNVLGDRVVDVRNGTARLANGTLAGSVLTMDAAVRALVTAGATVVDAVHAATRVPAELMGRPELGTLAPGTAADIAILDDALRLRRTVTAGRETYAA